MTKRQRRERNERPRDSGERDESPRDSGETDERPRDSGEREERPRDGGERKGQLGVRLGTPLNVAVRRGREPWPWPPRRFCGDEGDGPGDARRLSESPTIRVSHYPSLPRRCATADEPRKPR